MNSEILNQKGEGMCDHGNFINSCEICAQEKKDTNESTKESEKRPEKLYRGFTMHPDELTVEKLKEVLVPGVPNEEDPTKIHDGNELGVYMSTNPRMVETVYARGNGYGTSYVEAPRYNDNGSLSNRIKLPNVALMVEIDTVGLDIRKPEITEYLKGVYNNGFEGDEWIADKVPPEFYNVQKLILSRDVYDKEKLVVTLDDNSDEAIQKAIDEIQEEYDKRREEAEEFSKALEKLTENRRISSAFMQKFKREWKEKKVEVIKN